MEICEILKCYKISLNLVQDIWKNSGKIIIVNERKRMLRIF